MYMYWIDLELTNLVEAVLAASVLVTSLATICVGRATA